jgi:hypothetical protein
VAVSAKTSEGARPFDRAVRGIVSVVLKDV